MTDPACKDPDCSYRAEEAFDTVAERLAFENGRLRKLIELHKWGKRGEGDLVDVELWEEALGDA